MLAPLPSLEAFRRDIVTVDGGGLDDGCAAQWLESATRLERAAMTRGADRERLLTGFLVQQGLVPFPSTGVSTDTLASAVTSLAGELEDQAFFRLAHSVLSSLLLLISRSDVLLRGRIVAQQGRIARHLGEFAAAARYYQTVEVLGEDHGFPELIGRAWVGQGLLAHTRGDYPETRRRFQAVIDLPGVGDDSVALAHHQLMVAAATAKDYDTAAMHAWKAFEGARTNKQEAESLQNLAQLLLEAGHARAALRGFAAALARNPIPRIALPTLSGAACAAALAVPLAAARTLVRNFADRVEQLVTSLGDGKALPWPCTSALVEISEALVRIGDEQSAGRIAGRAEALASAHGFHELTYRLDHPPLTPAPAELQPATTAILAAVDELDGAELVGIPA